MPKQETLIAGFLSPQDAARMLRRFGKSTRFMAAKYGALVEQFPNQWVAVLDGEVQTTAKTLSGVNRKIHTLGLPRQETLVRYLDADERILIL